MKFALGTKEEMTNSLLGRRDAFHVACVLCIWDEDDASVPQPGMLVRFTGDAFSDVRRVRDGEKPHGVIDPFLSSPPHIEDMFWVLLMPGLASAPRHDFEMQVDDLENKGQWDCRNCAD